MLQIDDYTAAYDEILQRESSSQVVRGKISKRTLEKVIVKPDLRVVKTMIKPFASIKKYNADESLVPYTIESSDKGWLVNTNSPVSSPEISKIHRKKSGLNNTYYLRGSPNARNDVKKDPFRITVSPTIRPMTQRSVLSPQIFDKNAFQSKTTRFADSTGIPDHSFTKNPSLESVQKQSQASIIQESNKNEHSDSIVQSHIRKAIEVSEKQRPQLKTIKNNTEAFIQSSMSKMTQQRLMTFEKFGFFEKERKDPIFRRQLNILREEDLSGKVFSSDFWTNTLHHTNMNSAGLYESRHKMINFCFRANAGIGTKLFKIMESNRNRNKQHQIEGKIQTTQKLWNHDREEYNKVTNKIKRKYVKVILNKRGHDIDLTAANPGSGGRQLARLDSQVRRQSDHTRLDNIMADLTVLHRQTRKYKK